MLTLDTILDRADEDPDYIIDELSNIIDNPKMEIPASFTKVQDVLIGQELQSYYIGMYGFLISLWGCVRVNAGKDSNRIAVRDFLEKAASVCKLKYEAASRGLTGFQLLQEEAKDVRRI